VGDNFKKLNVELPPSVCAPVTDVANKTIMVICNRTGYEYEKSFGKPGEIYITVVSRPACFLLDHENKKKILI
jgi:hypothetical protein